MSFAGAAAAISFAASLSSAALSSADAPAVSASSAPASEIRPSTPSSRIRVSPSIGVLALVRRTKQVLAVIAQLTYGLAYVLQRDVRALLVEARRDVGHPAPHT